VMVVALTERVVMRRGHTRRLDDMPFVVREAVEELAG